MDSPLFRMPATPKMPLFPVSPERVQNFQSPSMPEFGKPAFEPTISLNSSPLRHSRNNSEALVQGMVARFDGLSIKDFKQRDEVVMKRLEMSKELAELETNKIKETLSEHEAEIRRFKEEAKKMRKELEELRERDRKSAKRVEVARDEIERAKATHEHAVGIYEKEIRRARKEAFKSSSSLVKIQEELKGARNSNAVVRQSLEMEKLRAQKYEQEAFASQYKLVGLQEEYNKVAEKCNSVEEERDELKKVLKEEEVAKIAAEGRIALPGADDDEDDFAASPIKSPTKATPFDSEDKENMVPAKKLELRSLQDDLMQERRLRQRAEEQVEFMKMECQFGCCSCRIAETRGQKYVYDASFEVLVSESKPTEVTVIDLPRDIEVRDFVDDIELPEGLPELRGHETQPISRRTRPSDFLINFSSPVKVVESGLATELPEEAIMDDDDEMIETDEKLLSDQTPAIEVLQLKTEEQMEEPVPIEHEQTIDRPRTPELILLDAFPATPVFKTITQTTTIPMQFSPFPFTTDNSDRQVYPASAAAKLTHDTKTPLQPATPSNTNTKTHLGTPMTLAHPIMTRKMSESPFPNGAFRPDGTFDREAALEQIRARRGRARSVVLGRATPLKAQLVAEGRRDISAPVYKGVNRS